MKKKTIDAWVLMGKNTFIAAFRFKPKRVYIARDEGRGYYAWTDCNGPKYSAQGVVMNTIEGSMNARCFPVTFKI